MHQCSYCSHTPTFRVFIEGHTAHACVQHLPLAISDTVFSGPVAAPVVSVHLLGVV